ncbi:hypothetical protein BC835DRAFT_1420504 [Cytidiella melzeri]|nr:hypothetical protein BC835DRAFT_1420504 [Cytidiella melzeri]
MSYKQYRASPSGSSCSGSTSSHDGFAILTSDRFFQPEYPPEDINSWRSALNSSKYEDPAQFHFPQSYGDGTDVQTPSDVASTATGAPLYPPLVNSGIPGFQGASHQPPRFERGASLGKHPRLPHQTPTPSPADDAPPTKRSKKEQIIQSGRVSGACTRCKRLKMKCTFQDDDTICARCIVGGHECVVLGRKPRSPGMRDILRKKIREKDSMIDSLLARLNPTSATATPLSIAPSRMALTPEQRTIYRDILAYYEKGQGSCKSACEGFRRFDLSTLEEDSDYDSDSEESTGLEDLQESTSALHIHPLPAAEAPSGLVAKTALESRVGSPASAREHGSSEGSQIEAISVQEEGIGNLAYFEPGPSSNLDIRRLIVERQAAPDILLSGLITNEDVGKLFDIYWRWINPVVPILDENIHTPSAVLGRCPFLFTVVCAVSSRFYDDKPEVYHMAVHMAKASAANAFLDGWKTVEMCQAFLLMAAYMPPAKRWDEDRTWFYSGVAFRLAVDLDLGRVPSSKPADERGERELLNRLRVYAVCYTMDRCYCLNLGKPAMMPENELIRSVSTELYGWKYGQSCDGYLASLIELFRIIGRYPELSLPKATATVQDLSDFKIRHKVMSGELDAWNEVFLARCAAEHLPTAPEDDRLRMALVQSMYQYCRLVSFSTGLQRVVQAGKLKDDVTFLPGCLSAASAIINCVVDRILPSESIRYCPEYYFALSAFATAVLVKCLRPEFATKIDNRQEARIIDLVKRLLKTLDSGPLDPNGQPTPRHCFARFLEKVLTSRITSRQKRHSADLGVQPQSSPLKSEISPPPPQTTDVFPPMPDPLPVPTDRVVNQFSLHPSDPAFLQAWSLMENQEMPGTMESLLGFQDSQFPSDFMAFQDQSWLM